MRDVNFLHLSLNFVVVASDRTTESHEGKEEEL